MHTKLRFSIFLIISILSPSLLAQIDTLCNGGATYVMGNEYRIANNVWGANHGDQCIAVDLDSSFFKVTLSTHNSSDVAAYPFIFKGCHFGGCTLTNNPMPIKIQNIQSAPVTWAVNTQSSSGTWNSAMDIWFDNSSSYNGDYDAELMIWIDYNGGAGPAGAYQTTVDLGGYSWDLYFVSWTSWNYIAYKITSPVDSISFDIKDFIQDAAVRGFMYTTWYLHAIEAGFEIWSDGQELTSKYFSTDVSYTSAVVNLAPVPFYLQFPSNNATMNSTDFSFRWQNSDDPDQDEIEYIVRVFGPDGDTTIAGIEENRYSFNGSQYFTAGSSYSWYVQATDGKDTTVSTDQRMFTISPTVDVDHFTQVPDEFSLSQNFPNPFNPSTRISYSLKSSGKTYLSIIDVLGREVAVLVNKFQSTGIHSIQFSGHDIPSGIYFYTLQTVDGIITKKMILLK